MGFLVTLAVPLSAGATVVTMPRFDPGQFLELIQRHRVTVLVGAPPMLRVLAGHPAAAGADLESLELVVCGGAALSAAAQEALAERLPGRDRRPGLGADRDQRRRRPCPTGQAAACPARSAG